MVWDILGNLRPILESYTSASAVQSLNELLCGQFLHIPSLVFIGVSPFTRSSNCQPQSVGICSKIFSLKDLENFLLGHCWYADDPSIVCKNV